MLRACHVLSPREGSWPYLQILYCWLYRDKRASLFAFYISDEEKTFASQAPAANFIKLFWQNLHCYGRIALSFESGYASRDLNCAEKSFMKLTPGEA